MTTTALHGVLTRHVAVGVPGRSSRWLVPVALAVCAAGLVAGGLAVAGEPAVAPATGAVVLALALVGVAALHGSVQVPDAGYSLGLALGIRTALALHAPVRLVLVAMVAEAAVLAVRTCERTGLKVAYNVATDVLGVVAARAVLGDGAGPLRLVLAAAVMIAVHHVLVWLAVTLAVGRPHGWLHGWLDDGVATTLAVDLGTAPLLVLAVRQWSLAPLLVLVVLSAVAWSVRRTDALRDALAVDDLTGLGNRRHLRDRAAAVLAAGPATLVVLDLDGFKAVNDRHGHPAGDAVLVEVGRRLRGAAPDGATAVRLGGDEFALLLPGHDARDADAVLARLRLALAEPVALDGGAVPVGLSHGLAVAPADGTGLAALVGAADRRLYAAKRSR